MKKLFLVFMFIASSYLQAQESSNKPLKTNKQWEIGGDFKGAILNRDFSENNLFFQKSFLKKFKNKTKNISHRYGINIISLFHENTSGFYADNVKWFNVEVSMGKQWTQQQNKFQWYYGEDIEFDINYTFHSNDSVRSLNSFLIALNSFIGVRYYIHKQFSVSWEGALTLNGRQQRTGWDSPFNSFGIGTVPIYAIRLLYVL